MPPYLRVVEESTWLNLEVDAGETSGSAVVLHSPLDLNTVAGRRHPGCGQVGRECDAHPVEPRRCHPTGATRRNSVHTMATTPRAPSTATTSIAVPPAKS